MTPVLGVRFYATANGAEPVHAWLRALPPESRRAIGVDIKTVQFGWPRGMPLVRKLEPALWEVRSAIPDGTARVVFTTVGPIMVLLHGFVKKSARMPTSDLKLVQQRKREVHDDQA